MSRHVRAQCAVPSEECVNARAWWVIVGVLALSVVINYTQVVGITNNHDFAVYYQAAMNLRRGRDIYADCALFKEAIESGTFDYKAEDTVWPYAYPPLLATLLLPLSYLSYAWASGLWIAVNLAALVVGTWLCLRALGPVTLPRLALALLLLYGYRPAIVTLRLGQIDMFIFLLLAAVFYCMVSGSTTRLSVRLSAHAEGSSNYSLVSGREWLAGVVLGLAVGLKFFAGVLVAYLFWKRRWRPAICATVTAAILLVGSFAVVNFDAVFAYLDFTSLYSRGGFAGYPYHQCFNAFFTRLLEDNLFVAPIRGWDLPWLADILTLICSGAVGLTTAWLCWGTVDLTDRRFALEFGLVVTALLLVMPPSPLYSFTWLLLPFLALLVDSMETQVRTLGTQRVPVSEPACAGLRSKALTALGLTALAYIITARDYPYRIRFIIRVLQSHYLFGALLLWLVLAWWLWTTRKDGRLPQPFVSDQEVVVDDSRIGGRPCAPHELLEERCDR